jgi:hypothetical protein
MRHLPLLLFILVAAPVSNLNAQSKADAAKTKENRRAKKALLELLDTSTQTAPEAAPVTDVLVGAPEADLERMRREIEPCTAEMGAAAGAKWRQIRLVADGPRCELVEAGKTAQSEIAACYDALVERQPEAEGALTLRFAPGKAPRRTERSGLDGALEECVLTVLREKAPRGAQGTLTLKFVFFGSSGAVAPGR